MLRADSRFWLVNNREIWSRISRLTSSAWDIKTKERHWWRHNGDSDRRPLSLPLRYDLVTLCLYDDLDQINVIAGILKLRKRFRMSQILFKHGINSLPLVCFRGYGNLSTLSIATTLGLRPRVVLRCSVWINSRIRVSKQGVTNNILSVTIHPPPTPTPNPPQQHIWKILWWSLYWNLDVKFPSKLDSMSSGKPRILLAVLYKCINQCDKKDMRWIIFVV